MPCRSYLFALLAPCAHIAAGTVMAVPTDATPAVEFLSSIGANAAVSVRGENLSSTIEATRYTGIRWFRLGYESDIPVDDLIELHRSTGARFSYGLQSGGNDLGRLLEGARRLARAGALIAVEGNNEPNNWGVTYAGEVGGRDLSWIPVARLQADLYAAVKSDPVLRGYPVWSPTEVGAQTDNVGLQFLVIPDGAGLAMPDGTRYADFANCHNYLTHPSWPGLHDNQAWIAADPGPDCRVDGLYGNFGRTWLKGYTGYTVGELLTLPRVTTETGVTLGGEITEDVQGKLILCCYLSQFKRGWRHTAVYLLRDRIDEAGNQTFGFFRPDYSPRLSATYLRNLTTVLWDDAAPLAQARLDYTIADPPETVHDLLLAKSDGTYALVVWAERFEGGADDVTVQFGEPIASLAIYDPTVAATPICRARGLQSVELSLTDHPVILEVLKGR